MCRCCYPHDGEVTDEIRLVLAAHEEDVVVNLIRSDVRYMIRSPAGARSWRHGCSTGHVVRLAEEIYPGAPSRRGTWPGGRRS